MAKKVVKTFNVDADAYNWLVEKFKEAGFGVSVSAIVDGYLRYIYNGLRNVLAYMEIKKIDMPVSYVIHRYLLENVFYIIDYFEVPEKGRKEKDVRSFIEYSLEVKINRWLDDYQSHAKLERLDKASETLFNEQHKKVIKKGRKG